MFQMRNYQQRCINELARYFKSAHTLNAKEAFVLQTARPYRVVPELEDLPYVCLRVPTGGGKTVMACHALGVAAREYLQMERVVCLWLVPSNAILEQTLKALKDREHPYRQSVEAYFPGQVEVMTIKDALYVTRGTLDGATVIIVSTLAALRVEETDGRKVYESAGALEHHFNGLSPMMRARMETIGDGIMVYSLANVLRMRRPVVIMDEAHNARTSLSFETLVRVTPSCVIEFTATPQTTHKPERGEFASNVLCHVSARELKADQMLKLPVKLRTRPDQWKEVIGDALQKQRELEAAAVDERQQTGEYLRPIVLFQAEPKNQNRPTLTVEVVKQALVDDFRVPPEQIAVATGQTRELEDVDLGSPNCPIRFIITVQALREGWDCPFAYILCSVAAQRSSRAVEQILGRVLRMPNVRRKRREELNFAYAYAVSSDFVETAASLRDALIENGFQRLEAADLIVVPEQHGLFEGVDLFRDASETVTETPDLSEIADDLRQRVAFDQTTGTLTVTGAMSASEVHALRDCFHDNASRAAVERIAERLEGRTANAETPEKPSQALRVPLLAVRVNGQLELFDDGFFLDAPWNLAEWDATLSEAEFSLKQRGGVEGEIDVTDAGKVEMVRFSAQLQEQLSLFASEPNWTAPALANWLDRQIPHPDISQDLSSLFIHNALTKLIQERSLSLEQVARFKYRLRDALETKIDCYRREQRQKGYQAALFGPDSLKVEVSSSVSVTIDEDLYAPNWYYDGSFRFRKHSFKYVGELKSDGEEFDCAALLDGLREIKVWIRNVPRSEASFWLQTSTDRFYPDFIALLKDDRFLALEYKNETDWTNDDSKEKRAVGALWAERSGGHCLFIMPKGKDWGTIRALVASGKRS